MADAADPASLDALRCSRPLRRPPRPLSTRTHAIEQDPQRTAEVKQEKSDAGEWSQDCLVFV